MEDLPPEALPRLRNPIMIAAFEGWNDAGEAATGAISHLEEAFQARPLIALDPEEYYDYQVNRPTVALVDGVSRRIEWPTTRFSVCTPPGSATDLVLVAGIEPNMRWRAYCAETLGIASALGVTTVVILGALLADTVHTRPVPVTGAAWDAATAEKLGLKQSQYEGPTGIVGVLQDACIRAGLPAVSLWAAVPHYVREQVCPKAVLALLRRVEDFIDRPLPMGDLPELAKQWQDSVDAAVHEDAELTEYVQSLEEREPELDMEEASGEAIAREFERYLRRRGQ